MAVRVGFEPTEESPPQRFSRPPDSTALAPHRKGDGLSNRFYHALPVRHIRDALRAGRRGGAVLRTVVAQFGPRALQARLELGGDFPAGRVAVKVPALLRVAL